MDEFKRDVIAIITILVVVSVAGGAVWYLLLNPVPVQERKVIMGDKVTVDYAGWFDDGRVFDTSLPGVATDNATYPKAVNFQFRGVSAYKPFEFTVGQGVIVGWSEGVIGMTLKETRTVVVPSEKGYGLTDRSKVLTMPIVESQPVIEQTSVQWFKDNYSTNPNLGTVVKDKTYGWEKTVISVEGDVVLLKNEPAVGDRLTTTWPWKGDVISIDSNANAGLGEIRVKNLVSPGDVNNTKGTYKGEGFFLTGLDIQKGTFTIDKNDFTVGKTLIFRITLLKFS